jgi:hypothetical protein
MTIRQEEVYEVLHAIGWELIEQVGGIIKLNFYDGKKLFRECEITQDGHVLMSDGSKLNFFKHT